MQTTSEQPQKVKFATQADPELLTTLRKIAGEEGRQLQSLVDEALREYVERKQGKTPRKHVMQALHHALLERYGGAKGIRDMGAVEAAVFRPQCGYYANIAEEAAALLESLLINYPFIDGNKRVAFAACGRCSWSQVRRARERSTMNKVEKLRLSADLENGYCFKQGLFVRLYEESLYLFVHHVRPLKIMPETTKQGERLLYGGLPVSNFETLIRDNKL